jgi:4-aminobutyrate aminotransferase-like enzyme
VYDEVCWADAPLVPRLITAVPGPKSLAAFEREQAFQAAGTSAGAQWSRLAVMDGRGAVVRDADGNYLLDACSGTVVMNIGHGNAAVASALFEQARRLTHFYDFAAPIRAAFLEAVRDTLPRRLDAFQLLNSGTEAVETALRIVRSATGRHQVIAFHGAYHGRSLGALSLTTGAGRQGLGPFLPGVVHAPTPFSIRIGTGAPTADECALALRQLDALVTHHLAELPAAVFIEPVQGAGGTYPMPDDFLIGLRNFCDRTGALLVFDEILTGAGRTGRMWAFEHSGVEPDLLLSGKGLAGGFPFGLVAGPRAVMDAGPVAQPTHNSSTFGGGQLACAAGLAALAELRESGMIANSARVGDYLLAQLRRRVGGHDLVRDIRGRGLLVGVELVPDRPGAAQYGSIPELLLTGMLARGVVISSHRCVCRQSRRT